MIRNGSLRTGRPSGRTDIADFVFKRRVTHICLCLILSVFMLISMCGCKKDEASEDTVKTFFLNTDKSGLGSRPYKLEAETADGQVEELLEELSAEYPEEGLTGPISGFVLKSYSILDNSVTIDFSAGYKDLDQITEKLTRAAIVNTLCGLKDIRKVTIRVNGALIVDEHGKKSEDLTSDQFIYNSGNEMLNFERTEMHLYFASEDGKKLVETYRTVVYNGNIPMERLVAEQIIVGPKGDFNYPTINPATKVINVMTRDNICTVTFDKTFLTNPYPVEPEVAIYSIVNSLTELPSIRQVQIIIDGEEHPLFMEHYSLDTENLLQKNTKLIQSKE